MSTAADMWRFYANRRGSEKMPTIFDFSSYQWQHWVTFVMASVATFMAIWSLGFFLSPKLPQSREAFVRSRKCLFIIFFWSLGVPAWFLFEYFVLWDGADAAHLERVKVGRELAQPIWAAVLASLLLLAPGR